jgi:hypothetical protein
MTLNQVLKYVNYICVKENSGSTLKPDQLNFIFPASDINMFNRKVQEAQLLAIQSRMPFNKTLYEHMALREFHVTENITFTSGIFDITTLIGSYAYWLSMITLYNGSYREIEILTDKDLTDRRTNLITKQLEDYPGAMILGNTIKVYPTNITTAEFVFMKNPVTPVFDYYYDANLNLVYLAAGATHLLTTGETGSAGQTAGTTVTSLTVELDWNELWHVDFCNEVLQKIGINLKDEQIRAYVREVEGKQS